MSFPFKNSLLAKEESQKSSSFQENSKKPKNQLNEVVAKKQAMGLNLCPSGYDPSNSNLAQVPFPPFPH